MIYCLDQDHGATASMGIYNYTRKLLQHLARIDDPGLDIVALLGRGNAENLDPPSRPPWMKVLVHRGEHATGVRRVIADHWLAPRLARRCGASLIHYPKGWRSLVVPGGIRSLVTMHDTIPDYLRARYPARTSRARAAYFRLNAAVSATRSTHVLTISRYSRDCLVERYPTTLNRISVVYEGPGITCSPLPVEAKGNQVLVIGSDKPHKATAETLRLLAGWTEGRQDAPLLRIAGLNGWPSSWGPDPGGDAAFLGRIPDAALAEELARARALVFLSEMEGFGLPFVEAWLSGTPVCFRDAHALAEIGAGFPGAWDGASAASFGRAMDQVLTLSPAEINKWREKAEATFDWDRTARETAAIYRQLTGV